MFPRMLSLMLVMAVMSVPAFVEAAPRLEISSQEYDFGEIQFGKQATATFTVRNTGNKVLVIDRVRTSCGCTKAELSSSELPPKQSTGLTVRFDSSGLKAGKKIKTVFLESNDRGTPVAKLRIFADIIKEIAVEPSGLVTRLTGSNDGVEFTLTARNKWNAPVTLALSTVQGSLTKAALNPKKVTILPGSQSKFSVNLELPGKDNPKLYRGRLILETNHPSEKWIGLPYFIKVDTPK